MARSAVVLPKLIVIGASAGGVTAIQKILGKLRPEMTLPIVVVQHLARSPRTDLSQVYVCGDRRPVCEPEDKQPIEAGRVYFATPDYHLLMERDRTFAVSQDEHVHYSRPSIDVTFLSALKVYGPEMVGILLTGANRDGANGLCQIFQKGGIAIAQDPEEAEVAVMPKAAIDLCGVEKVMRLSAIADFINSIPSVEKEVTI